MASFRGFPDIDRTAIRQGVDQPLAAWYGMRIRDSIGRGVVAANVPPRILHAGEGRFWTADRRGRLFLYSPARVGQRLGVDRFRASYLGSGSFLRGLRRQVRARLALNAVTILRGRRRTSTAAMGAMFGVSPRTIQRWQKETRWPRTAQFDRTVRLAGRLQKHPGVPESRVAGPWVIMQRANVLGRRARPEGRAVRRRLSKRLALLNKPGGGQQPSSYRTALYSPESSIHQPGNSRTPYTR